MAGSWVVVLLPPARQRRATGAPTPAHSQEGGLSWHHRRRPWRILDKACWRAAHQSQHRRWPAVATAAPLQATLPGPIGKKQQWWLPELNEPLASADGAHCPPQMYHTDSWPVYMHCRCTKVISVVIIKPASSAAHPPRHTRWQPPAAATACLNNWPPAGDAILQFQRLIIIIIVLTIILTCI